MRTRLMFFLGAAWLLIPAFCFASHLKIDNAMITEVNAERKTATIQCTVSWDNAWKDDVNSDGVWVFTKFLNPDGVWKHVTLKSASGSQYVYKDCTPPRFFKGENPDVGMLVPDEKKGFFLFRTQGSGNVVAKNVQFVWAYPKDGLTEEQVMKTKIKVMGFEMVFIPKDKHYVGDPKGPDGPDNTLYTYPKNGSYLIKSEEPIVVDKVDGALFCDQDNGRSRDDVPFTIPKEFPKGYRTFWIMKYELTSQQFVDFLNTLTRKQQQSMVEADISGDAIANYYVKTNSEEEHLRNAIVCAKKGNGTTEPVKFYTYAPARAVNFMSWANIAAIGDWAGLRPITELEYEKAARGPKEAIADELAWGSPMTENAGRVETFDGADGSGYEKKIPQTGVVNACFGGGIAPFDVGKKTKPDNPGFEGPVSGEIFENSRHEGVDQKINDGASYYGVRNLSGNVWERCVTIGHPIGRSFTAQHGDGELDEAGFSNVPFWPGQAGAGAGNRGGVWSSPEPKYLRISLRFAANFPKSEDGKNSGCRLGF